MEEVFLPLLQEPAEGQQVEDIESVKKPEGSIGGGGEIFPVEESIQFVPQALNPLPDSRQVEEG